MTEGACRKQRVQTLPSWVSFPSLSSSCGPERVQGPAEEKREDDEERPKCQSFQEAKPNRTPKKSQLPKERKTKNRCYLT